jgi:hypothetical protein
VITLHQEIFLNNFFMERKEFYFLIEKKTNRNVNFFNFLEFNKLIFLTKIRFKENWVLKKLKFILNER